MSRRKHYQIRSRTQRNDFRSSLPESGYRQYLERCRFSGCEPEDFVTYLHYARRWRTEYQPAKDRGDFALMRELEELLCV